MAGNATISAANAKNIAKVVNNPNFLRMTKSANPNTPNPMPKMTDVKNKGLNITLLVSMAGSDCPLFFAY